MKCPFLPSMRCPLVIFRLYIDTCAWGVGTQGVAWRFLAQWNTGGRPGPRMKSQSTAASGRRPVQNRSLSAATLSSKVKNRSTSQTFE